MQAAKQSQPKVKKQSKQSGKVEVEKLTHALNSSIDDVHASIVKKSAKSESSTAAKVGIAVCLALFTPCRTPSSRPPSRSRR